jgi:hypothetical protein
LSAETASTGGPDGGAEGAELEKSSWFMGWRKVGARFLYRMKKRFEIKELASLQSACSQSYAQEM